MLLKLVEFATAIIMASHRFSALFQSLFRIYSTTNIICV